MVINGHKIDYTACAGTMLLRDADNHPVAEMFYIAYTRDGISNRASRPITFSFNGGPGSSSVWLHLGMLGPRRVELPPGPTPVRPPYRMVDNHYSLLDVSDLVFIDPIGTGYSRAIKPANARKYFGVQADVRSVAEFIRLYVTKNDRWLSPKFIIGESYGTTRAAALSGELARRELMNVDGIMLVSTVLNFQTLAMNHGNDLPYVLYLPSYSAVAWYHHKLSPTLEQEPLTNVLAQAKAFAAGPYNAALLEGSALSPAKRQKVVARTAALTGLTSDLVSRLDLRIPLSRFDVALLRKENRVIGRYDGRYSGYVRDRASAYPHYDPSYTAVASAFASTFNYYIRSELKYKDDAQYQVLAHLGGWDWGAENSYLNVGETLADTMTQNPFLRVHVSCGYYDLATPFFAAQYTFSHLRLAPAIAKNVTFDYYTAGHMIYLSHVDLKKSKVDLARFIHRTLEK